jgi:hypothetical protein
MGKQHKNLCRKQQCCLTFYNYEISNWYLVIAKRQAVSLMLQNRCIQFVGDALCNK